MRKYHQINYKLLLFSCVITLFGISEAQTGMLKGKITSGLLHVPYANIGLEGTTMGAAADSSGLFMIRNIPSGQYTVKVTAVGYQTFRKKVIINYGESVTLHPDIQTDTRLIDEVVITGTMKETYLMASPIKVEVITAKFLQTSPGSNIVEAVQSVNGVQEQVNCGVCGTNDIHINGMEGPYTLVMIDGMPIVSALSGVYGFNGIPTNLIDRIEIVKGPASSLYGTEAMGGVINIITKSPGRAQKISLNSWYTSHHERNLDFGATLSGKKKLKGLISGNTFNNNYRMDFNGDNFTDIPLSSRVSLFSKWVLERNNNRTFSMASRYYYEDRFGGVMQWKSIDRGSNQVYGESIYTGRIELIGSYQLPARENIRLDVSYNHHDQNSWYGKTPFMAKQSILFTNLVWDTKSKSHNLLSGASLRLQNYDDNTPATPNTDQKIIPGIFLQDEINLGLKTILLAGIRTDYHDNHGIVLSPRLALKTKTGEWTTWRLNAGKGFRLVNLFTEDHAALTGARTVVIADQLRPEQSYNVNLSINHVYNATHGVGSVDGDLFYTYFSNKIIPDYASDANLIIYNNLSGVAIVKGFSLSADHNFTPSYKIKGGLTIQDVYQTGRDLEGNQYKTAQEFAPWFTGTFMASAKFKKARLAVDYTGKINGPQHLPVFPEPFNRPEMSPWFTVQNVQITREFKKGIALFGGVKNLLDYTQPSPLIDPSNPFGDHFDTVYAYGPLQKRRFFGGIRFNLE